MARERRERERKKKGSCWKYIVHQQRVHGRRLCSAQWALSVLLTIWWLNTGSGFCWQERHRSLEELIYHRAIVYCKGESYMERVAEVLHQNHVRFHHNCHAKAWVDECIGGNELSGFALECACVCMFKKVQNECVCMSAGRKKDQIFLCVCAWKHETCRLDEENLFLVEIREKNKDNSAWIFLSDR